MQFKTTNQIFVIRTPRTWRCRKFNISGGNNDHDDT